MYTAHIGKHFVEIYNRKENSNLTAKEFFETVYFPLFYDNSRYLQHIGNAPFAQLFNQHKNTDPEARKSKLAEVISKIEEFTENKNRLPDMSFAVGATSKDMMLGQVTNLLLPFDADHIYGSWIGSGLGIGVKSGDKANLEFVIDEEEILWCLYEGWQEYRKYLDQTPVVKDKQIETWNGHWLQYKLSNKENNYFLPIETQKKKVNGETIEILSIQSSTWVELFYSLSNRFPLTVFTASVFGLGKMNTTMGFVRFNLQSIGKPFQIYQQLFGKVNGFATMQLAKLYETELGFLRACQNGVIGLRQLEPKDLEQSVKSEFQKNKDAKKRKSKDNNSEFNQQIYKSWILAMLNNIQLNELAGQTAQTLFDFFKKSNEGTTNQREQLVREILQSKTRRSLIESMANLLDKKLTLEQIEILTKVKFEAISNISADNISLFVALVIFDYKVLKNRSL